MEFESYWVDTLPQPSGEYLIHTESCRNLPGLETRTPLGLHTSCAGAVELAQLLLEHPVPCPVCVRASVTAQPSATPPPVKVKPHPPRPSNTLTVSARLNQPSRRRRSSKTSRDKEA